MPREVILASDFLSKVLLVYLLLLRSLFHQSTVGWPVHFHEPVPEINVAAVYPRIAMLL